MAVPIVNFDDFLGKYEELASESRLFAFLLCDDRPSLRGIHRFADEQFSWLDQLAASSQIFFFIFRPKNTSVESTSNPSLEVARLFRISPNRLPGIVLFTIANEDSVNKGVYIPLSSNLFDQDISAVENIFADIFTAIQDSLQATQTQDELWAALETKIGEVRSRRRMRSLVRQLRVLADLPFKFLESMVAALGEGAAKGITGQ